MVTCLGCGGELSEQKRRRRAKFCSVGCHTRYQNRQWGRVNPGSGVSSGTAGAIGELKVAADLLAKGYEVFRAVSPSCSCDLAILLKDQLLRVEVRTGYRSPGTGRIIYPKSGGKRDVMAVVLPHSIAYFGKIGDGPEPERRVFERVCNSCKEPFRTMRRSQQACDSCCEIGRHRAARIA